MTDVSLNRKLELLSATNEFKHVKRAEGIKKELNDKFIFSAYMTTT